MIFTDTHSCSSVCTPIRYGILMGRYNWRSRLKRGVLSGTSQALIPNNMLTVASFLKSNGYQTASIGKWHLGWDWALNDSSFTNTPIWDDEIFEKIYFSKKINNSPNDLGFDYFYRHCASLDATLCLLWKWKNYCWDSKYYKFKRRIPLVEKRTNCRWLWPWKCYPSFVW